MFSENAIVKIKKHEKNAKIFFIFLQEAEGKEKTEKDFFIFLRKTLDKRRSLWYTLRGNGITIQQAVAFGTHHIAFMRIWSHLFFLYLSCEGFVHAESFCMPFIFLTEVQND